MPSNLEAVPLEVRRAPRIAAQLLPLGDQSRDAPQKLVYTGRCIHVEDVTVPPTKSCTAGAP
jgi:hypothetical protein